MEKNTHEGLRDLDKDPDDSWTISFGGLSGRVSKPTAQPVSPDSQQAAASHQATDPWKERWEREHGPTPPEPPSSDEDEMSYRRDPRVKPGSHA